MEPLDVKEAWVICDQHHWTLRLLQHQEWGKKAENLVRRRGKEAAGSSRWGDARLLWLTAPVLLCKVGRSQRPPPVRQKDRQEEGDGDGFVCYAAQKLQTWVTASAQLLRLTFVFMTFHSVSTQKHQELKTPETIYQSFNIIYWVYVPVKARPDPPVTR